MAQYFEDLLQPVHDDSELARKHEADVEHLLSGVAPIFGMCVVLFAAWDFLVEPEIAYQALAVRSGATLLSALVYLPAARERSVLYRAGFMFSMLACAIIVSEVRAEHPSSVAGVTAFLAVLSLISLRTRDFCAMAAAPTILYVACAALQLPPREAINAVMMYLVGLVIAFVMLLAVRDFRRRALALERELVRISRHDSLTGAFNRGYITELALREVERARRHQRPLAVAMIDIDHFKSVNDAHGHDVGDKVIQETTGICSANLRSTDYFGRFGGEEFIVVMPETGEADALEVAERLRSCVEQAAVAGEPGAVKFTVSIGVAILSPGSREDWQGLLKRADVALYRGKEHGRNRVVLSERTV